MTRQDQLAFEDAVADRAQALIQRALDTRRPLADQQCPPDASASTKASIQKAHDILSNMPSCGNQVRATFAAIQAEFPSLFDSEAFLIVPHVERIEHHLAKRFKVGAKNKVTVLVAMAWFHTEAARWAAFVDALHSGEDARRLARRIEILSEDLDRALQLLW